MREIVAADFRDRIVHHLLVERMEVTYEPIFIHDPYSCYENNDSNQFAEWVKGEKWI